MQIIRGRKPKAAESAKGAASTPRRPGWDAQALHAEIVDEMRRYGADPSPTDRPEKRWIS